MTIQIQYQHMSTSESLSELVSRNLQKLGNKYQFVFRAQVLFKLENDPTGNGKICEIELSGPGPRLFAKSSEDGFEKATAATLDDLKRQLRKRKEKLNRLKKAI